MESLRDTLNIQYRNLKENNYIQYSIRTIKSKRNKKNYSSQQAMNKALYLVDKFDNPSGLNFYLKCAWNLTDEYIDWLVEYSKTKTNAARYFVSVASKEMAKNGN